MQTEVAIILAIAVGVLIAVMWRRFRSTNIANSPAAGKALSDFDRYHPTDPRYPYRLMDGVTQSAVFPDHPATTQTGMQWDKSWRFPKEDDGAFSFTATLDQGLLVGVARGQTDTAGGYLIHILAPDHEEADRYNFGVSDMANPNFLHTFYSVKMSIHEKRPQTFWIRYQPGGRFALGRGHQIGANVIFASPYPFKTDLHNLPMTGIRFFGFGTSSIGRMGYRTIDEVRVISSALP